MYKFKVVFINRETGEKKSCTVHAPGIVPAIDAAFMKALSDNHLFGYTMIKIELINE